MQSTTKSLGIDRLSLAERILLFLSRPDAKKGLDLLLPAFARLHSRDPKTALVLAGSGDPALVARLQHEAAQLGIGDDILWTGFLSGDDKWAALTDADLCAVMGRHGQALARRAFSLDAVTTRLVELYAEPAKSPVRLTAL
jgi:glycosyltransferase involved in cell wall biosynthesis